MGITAIPASSGGGISSLVKSIQRGVASVSGTITISSVDTTKTVVNSFSTGSGGVAAVNGGLAARNVGLNGTSGNFVSALPYGNNVGGNGSYYPNTGLVSATQAANYGGSVVYTTNPNNIWGAFNQSFNAANGATSASNFNAGTSTLAVTTYGATLTNATTITVTGPCQYEIVEYN